MHFWIINDFCGFLVSAVLSGFLIPQILLIAFRKRLFDEPDERKVHILPVPRLGGLAFTPVIFFTMAFLLFVNLQLGNTAILGEYLFNVEVVAMLLCSMTALYLVGIADDLIGVRYRAKFLVQLLCGVFFVMSDVWFKGFYGFLGFHNLNIWAGGILAIVLVVFITNAINLIDGIDGLASGLSAVACLYYGIVFSGIGLEFYAFLSFITLGVILPFFFYNVFGKAEDQKKIFMGDTGALTIGIILSLLSIKVTTIPANGLIWAYHPLVVAFSPLVVPCLDVIRVFVHRLRSGHHPFMPDKSHIHHKFLALGFNPRSTMLIIILVSLILSLFNLYISKYIDIHILLFLDFALYGGLNIYLTRKMKCR